jgi:Avidin family
MAVFLQQAVSVAPAAANTIAFAISAKFDRQQEQPAAKGWKENICPIGAKSMNKQITFSVVLGLALLNVCASVEAKPPTCTQPVGRWKNERGSVLEIRNYDAATGTISGQYISNSGATGSHPMVGWINSARSETSDSKGNHAKVITFAVHWGPVGGVSAWTGTCAVNLHSGLEQISALWHTTRPDTGFEWDHTLTGADRLDPID